jgi:hypothetical protein
MVDVTDLARATLNGGDQITIQLIRPADMPAVNRTLPPAVVHIVWPAQPTTMDPASFGEFASVVVRLFSEAHVMLARIKARRRTL